MRNLTLITLLLLFGVLYSAISRIHHCGYYNTTSIEIVNEKNEEEGFELYLKLPLFVYTAPSCLRNVYPVRNEYKQPDLLELHNTKEVTIGYFLML